MADSSYSEKLLNRHNTAMIQQIAVKFGMITHFDPLNPTGR